jgi:hypothetical protein
VKKNKLSIFSFIIYSILLLIIWGLSSIAIYFYSKHIEDQIILINQAGKMQFLQNDLKSSIEINAYMLQENNELFNKNQDLEQKILYSGKS